MSKQISLMPEVLTIDKTANFIIDDANDKTKRCTFNTLATNLENAIQTTRYFSTTASYKLLSYDNTSYIDNFSNSLYTQAYTASENCQVYWFIQYSCDDDVGLKLQILNGDEVVAEWLIVKSLKSEDAILTTKHGSVALGTGMTVRFSTLGSNFTTSSGNELRFLVVS